MNQLSIYIWWSCVAFVEIVDSVIYETILDEYAETIFLRFKEARPLNAK